MSTGLVRKSAAPCLHGPDRVLHRAEGGHDEDRDLGVGLQGRLQHLEAAARGKLEVGEDDQVARRLEPPAGLVGVARLVDAVAAALERLPQHGAERVLVFDDEDVGHEWGG